jgi:hypothetical protein
MRLNNKIEGPAIFLSWEGLFVPLAKKKQDFRAYRILIILSEKKRAGTLTTETFEALKHDEDTSRRE